MMAYVLMTALALLASALLLRPWWSQTQVLRMQRRAANVQAYKTRLSELDNDRASGLIDDVSVQDLKQELAAHLLDDAQATSADQPVPLRVSRRSAALVLILLFAFGASWYALAGSWRTQQLIEMARTNPEAAQQVAVQTMVQGLALRLEKNPDDSEGWAMLGRSYFVLHRYEDSAKAYARANQLSAAQNAAWLVAEGEALAMQQDRNLQGRPRQLFAAALRLNPDEGSALWYAGLAALQAEDYGLAQRHWLDLSRQDLPAEMREVLMARLAELAQLSGAPLPAAQPAAPVVSLDLEIVLAPALKDQVPADATLFVFAKAQNGPPMPLAVQRLQNAKLPLRVKLDDSMAMMPQLRLSQHESWVVTARLTRGGTVQAESGDLQGQINVIRADAGKPVRVLIDQRVP